MRHSVAVIGSFCVVLSTMSASLCAAQGLTPIDQCPTDLKPIIDPSPTFPESGEWQLSVTVGFVLDRDGSVLVPRIQDAKWTVSDKVGTIPPAFEKAIIDAFSKWRFPPRPKPCKGSIRRGFSQAF
jgi:hypothetical protein